MKKLKKQNHKKLSNFKKEEVKKTQTIKGGDGPKTKRGTEVIVN